MSDADSRNYARDPGDRFASDVHRRVLAHLSLPDDNYGWRPEALVRRMSADRSTNISDSHEMTLVLEDLESEGHAERVEVGGGDSQAVTVWKMTEAGFGTLTGGIKDEPPPDAAVAGAAEIEAHFASSAATLITGGIQTGNGSAPSEEEGEQS